MFLGESEIVFSMQMLIAWMWTVLNIGWALLAIAIFPYLQLLDVNTMIMTN